MTNIKKTSELQDAIALAALTLERPHGNQNCDLYVLSRQLLKLKLRVEWIEEGLRAIANDEVHDPAVHACTVLATKVLR